MSVSQCVSGMSVFRGVGIVCVTRAWVCASHGHPCVPAEVCM
jgi:hypothetical protein